MNFANLFNEAGAGPRGPAQAGTLQGPRSPDSERSREGGGLGNVARFTKVTVALWFVLLACEAARVVGIAVPRELLLLAGVAAAVAAATVSVRHVAFIWRGPIIVSFRRSEGMLCDAREAEVVRAAAQLRGTMGGAGHLHRWRLAISAAAWGAASVQAVLLLLPDRAPMRLLPLGFLLVASSLALLVPACPFYYREAAGGCVLAFPADACMRLLVMAGLAPEPTGIDMREPLRSRLHDLGGGQSAEMTAGPDGGGSGASSDRDGGASRDDSRRGS